jgi:hypothetical protein
MLNKPNLLPSHSVLIAATESTLNPLTRKENVFDI